jgi:trigger factor
MSQGGDACVSSVFVAIARQRPQTEGTQTVMQVTAEQTSPCTITLDINVDEEQVAQTFDSTYKEFSRHVNVPGFRPGKAPRTLVERYVNKERVQQQALEQLVRDCYFKAIEDEGITPYRNPEIQPADLEDHKPFSFKAIVPLEPQVTLGEYTGLTVDRPIFKVTDEIVEKRIDAVRQERARLERITDRGIEAGDIVIAEKQEIIAGAEGDEAEPAPARRQLIQMGQNIPGFDDAILGMMPGEERTFELPYPDDYAEEDKRGKTATYTIKVSSISGKKLPELNDEFAKSVAGVDTVEELRTAVRDSLAEEAEQLSGQLAEQRLFAEILGRSTIFFPEVLIREEVEDNLRQLAQELRQRNVTYGQFLSSRNQTAEQHQTELAQQAEYQIRTLLALREISIQEELQATNEQVDAEFDRLLEQGAITEDQYDEYKPDGRRRLQIANALIQQRLHDFLFAHNTINDVEQPNAPDPEALAEAAEQAAEETTAAAATEKQPEAVSLVEEEAPGDETPGAETPEPQPEAADSAADEQ